MSSIPAKPQAQRPSPFRNVDRATPEQLRTRAWWLLGFTLIVPGLAQLVGGNRKLARFGLRATLTIWGLVA
ncbi:MAG: transcriptional regulator, partial [Microbacteriaceae bacterium]|nr:transcriptional regulator [Microbacteriaceae bacterium]